MKYNLTQYGQTISNTSVGDISLTTDELIDLTRTTSANVEVPVSGTTSGTLVLDCDLGSRVHVEDVRYFFDSTITGSIIAPYIEFYYKNEDFETYTSLNTYYNDDYYYTTVSGTDAPRYIRVKHTVVSGLGGFINGFQALNDDTYVDFGEDGTETNTNVSLTMEDNLVEINELQVYNSGPIKADAKLILEPQNTVADEILSISTSEDGPWYGVYRDDDLVAKTGTWETGTMDDVEEQTTALVLSIGNTEGTYTTRILNLDEYQQLTFVIMNYIYPTNDSIIATDSIDTTENIEVKSSNSRPMDRDSYIELYDTGSLASLRYRWVEDGTIDTDGPTLDRGWSTRAYWEVWNDSITEDNYIVYKGFRPGTGSGEQTQIYLIIKRRDGTYYELLISTSYYAYGANYNTYKLSPDNTGGFWIYFYLRPRYFDTGYYYLRYYNSALSQIYNRQATDDQGTFLYDMDSVYESAGDLWYTDTDLSTVFKIDRDGVILTSYLATEGVRGLFALNDGGCWFIQQQALIRLDSNGQVVDQLELPSSVASYVYSDLEDGFWLQDGWAVRHLNSDGSEDFNVEITDLLWITVMHSGVITKQHDGSTTTPPQASYISKDHKRIIRTWDYPQNEGEWTGNFDYSRYGARSHTYDDLVGDHASNFPIAIDNDWNTFTEWTKVSLRDYNFTNDQYHQMRITLRADDSNNSPELYGIWTQRAIEISDVYPNNYGDFYLKSDVTNLSVGDIGNYDSKIRAYWFLATE